MRLVETDEAIGARQDIAKGGKSRENRPAIECQIPAPRREGAGKKFQAARAQRLKPVIRQARDRVIEAVQINLHALVEARLGQPNPVVKARLIRGD